MLEAAVARYRGISSCLSSEVEEYGGQLRSEARTHVVQLDSTVTSLGLLCFFQMLN